MHIYEGLRPNIYNKPNHYHACKVLYSENKLVWLKNCFLRGTLCYKGSYTEGWRSLDIKLAFPRCQINMECYSLTKPLFKCCVSHVTSPQGIEAMFLKAIGNLHQPSCVLRLQHHWFPLDTPQRHQTLWWVHDTWA